MLAVRSNERAAAAAGINVRNTKLAGFGIAAFVAGMAGALYAYNFGSVSSSRFGAADGARPDRVRLLRRHHDGLRRDHRRRRCDRGPPAARLRRVVRAVRDLGAAHRRRRADRHADRQPGGHRRSGHKKKQQKKKRRAARLPRRDGSAAASGVACAAKRRPGGGGDRERRRARHDRDLVSASAALRALDDVDLAVDEGQLVGLIGPNGAGKTTFIDAITGFVPYEGRVELDGQGSTGCRRTRARGAGSRGHGRAIELFDDLTVRENLTVASHRPSAWATVKETLSTAAWRHAGGRRGARRCSGSSARATRCRATSRRGSASSSAIARALAAEPRRALPRRAGGRTGHPGERGARRAACARVVDAGRRCC